MLIDGALEGENLPETSGAKLRNLPDVGTKRPPIYVILARIVLKRELGLAPIPRYGARVILLRGALTLRPVATSLRAGKQENRRKRRRRCSCKVAV